MNRTASQLRDPIFKGCTRPAMKLGVPLVPLVLTFVPTFITGMWLSALLHSLWPHAFTSAAFLALLFTMRGIARKDDQRFRQIGLAWRLHARQPLRRHFGAVTYTPYRFKRRRR